MILSRFRLSLHPLAWVPADLDEGTPDSFRDLLDTAQPIRFLVVARPYDATLEVEGIGLPGPLSRTPLSRADLAVLGGERAVYLGDGNYRAAATDTPAFQAFPGVLDGAYSVQAEVGSPDDPLGPGAVGFGDVTIANGRGTYDDLVRGSWSGRGVTVYAGRPEWEFARFAVVLRGTAGGVVWGEDAIGVSLRSRLATLDSPYQLRRYAGTGGAEGPSDLAGQVVPEVVGRRRSVPMILLDEAKQIWQACRAASSITGVRNRGLAVTASGSDFASYAALAAASAPAAGAYATCVAEGLVRFGTDVTLPTADVDGPSAAGTTASDMIRWVVKNRLPPALLLTEESIEGGSFNRVEAARPWIQGVHVAAETTVGDVVARIMRNVGGFALPTRGGLLSLGLYAVPAGAASSVTARDVDTAGIECLGRARACRRAIVGYRPMTRVLSSDEMPDTVSAADRAYLGAAYRTVTAASDAVDLDAYEYRFDSDLDDAGDAQDLADLIAAMLGTLTVRYRVPLRKRPFQFWPGDVWSLDYPRFGLAGGRPFLVVGLAEDGAGGNTVDLWGAA